MAERAQKRKATSSLELLRSIKRRAITPESAIQHSPEPQHTVDDRSPKTRSGKPLKPLLPTRRTPFSPRITREARPGPPRPNAQINPFLPQEWPTRTWSIPILIKEVPHIDTTQRHLNAFLEKLSIPDGPVVFNREISARDGRNRDNIFYNHERDGEQWYGEPGDSIEPIRLRDYAATVPEALRSLNLKQGTIFLTSSTQTNFNMVKSMANRRYKKTEDGSFIGNPSENTNWHNTVVYIHSRPYPVCGRRRWERGDISTYKIDTMRRVRVYDPSYVNESSLGLASRSIKKTGRCNIGHFLYMRTVFHMIKALIDLRLAVKDNLLVGGGGNVEPMYHCRMMCCNFIQQLMVLVANENQAIEAFMQDRQSVACQIAFENASDELEAFFDGWTPADPW